MNRINPSSGELTDQFLHAQADAGDRLLEMNKINQPSGELTDQFLHAQADAGNRLLEDQGFHYWPTQDEMKKLALEGQSLLSADNSKQNSREQQESSSDDFNPFSILAIVAIGIAVLVFT